MIAVPHVLIMKCLLKTTDPAILSFAEAVLRDAGIEHFVMDAHMSILEPGIMIPKRLMVLPDDAQEARQALTDADLGRELEPLQ